MLVDCIPQDEALNSGLCELQIVKTQPYECSRNDLDKMFLNYEGSGDWPEDKVPGFTEEVRKEVNFYPEGGFREELFITVPDSHTAQCIVALKDLVVDVTVSERMSATFNIMFAIPGQKKEVREDWRKIGTLITRLKTIKANIAELGGQQMHGFHFKIPEHSYEDKHTYEPKITNLKRKVMEGEPIDLHEYHVLYRIPVDMEARMQLLQELTREWVLGVIELRCFQPEYMFSIPLPS